MAKYAFQLRAATAAAAVAAVASQIAALGDHGAGCNTQAAQAAARALVEDLPTPAAGHEILVVITGYTPDAADTEQSLGVSVYLVPKLEDQPAESSSAPPAPRLAGADVDVRQVDHADAGGFTGDHGMDHPA